LAAGAAAAAAAIAGIGAASVQANRQFEKAMSDLSAITGATGKQLEFLETQALAVGAATSLSASEAAEAFKLIASAKPDLLESGAALTAVTKSAVTLAEAAGVTLPDAARTLGSALNQFGADASEADRYINILAAGSKFGAAEVTEVAEALKVAGVSAASAKIPFEQANAAIQSLAAVSIKGSEAGTALRNIILKLETGADQNLRPSVVGLTGAISNLADMNLTASELVKQFGLENVNAAQALVEAAAETEELTDKLTGTNTAMEQAATRTNNLDGDMKQLSSASETLTLVIGDSLNPAMRELTQLLTGAAGGLSNFLDSMNDAPKTIGGTQLKIYELHSEMKELEEAARNLRSEGSGLFGPSGLDKKKASEYEERARALREELKKLQETAATQQGKPLAGATESAPKDTSAKDAADKARLEREKALIAEADRLEKEKDAKKAAREAKSASSSAAAAQREYDSKITALAREQQAEEDAYQRKLASAGEFNARMDALDATELEKAANDRSQRMIENQMYFNNGLISEEQYQLNLTAIKSKYTNERIAIEENELRAKQMLQSSMLGSASGFFDGMAGMASAAAGEQSNIYRATFALSKGFATAKAALDMKMAISDAMSKGFPQNIPLMAQAASAGAQIASTIGGLSYSGAYDKGGYISAGSFGVGSEKRDEFINGVLVKGPARITGGSATEKKIEAAANGGGGDMYVTIHQTITGNGDEALAKVVDKATKNALNECQSDFAKNGRLRKTLGV
ncbi:MAG: phage tail tape measure protein, partial [Shewanella sp.]